ncbi:nucleoside deaminase [Furfurilactobacillus curtus]|uniref:tRNA-specific adenosine deaminase n=1 Tax=Furfurilactobacillus curtus TaxID=1746200 RepID=A0ABQ5JQT8_9LACO
MSNRQSIELTDDQIDFGMREALAQARIAGSVGEVPIGAVVMHEGQIVGRGYNLREHAQDATLHAEIMAISEANHTLKTWRLSDCQLFVTIEPCPMCSGAIINARVGAVYFGARDPKAGTVRSLYQLLEDGRFNHQVEVHEGIMAEAASGLMQTFFKAIRLGRGKPKPRQH